jgi:Arc/MetJ family transcription regulator
MQYKMRPQGSLAGLRCCQGIEAGGQLTHQVAHLSFLPCLDAHRQAAAPLADTDSQRYYVYNTRSLYTLVGTMRTNIVIDDDLMKDALKATGVKTKKEAVELGLQTLVRLNKQSAIKQFRGKLAWDGNLREARSFRR